MHTPFTSPTTAIAQEIVRMAQSISGRLPPADEDAIHSRYDRLGLDSVSIFQLQLMVETAHDILLPDNVLFEQPTPMLTAEAVCRIKAQPIAA